MKTGNEAVIRFKAVSENESFARSVAAAFLIPLNPTMEELSDIKTAVSEAVTNCIVHAYDGGGGYVEMTLLYKDGGIHITVSDSGKGIPDIKQAMQPFFTTGQENERSGMGFTVMETFMDTLSVESDKGGTTVKMTKKIGSGK